MAGGSEREPRNAEGFERDGRGVTRRIFLKGSGAAALGAAFAACRAPAPDQVTIPLVPRPATPPPDGVLRFLTTQEAEVLEALTARLIPSDDDGPGAREAGAVSYIDQILDRFDSFMEPIYLEGPIAEPVPDGEEEGVIEGDRITVNEDELERYGFQARFTAREAYRTALEAIEEHAQEEYGSSFAELDEEQQDEVIEALEEGDIAPFDHAPSGEAFFQMLVRHTVEGTFGDPIYGGNRNMVGWELLRYPGAQREYSPREMLEGTDKPPQSMAQLTPQHPGQETHPEATLPVAGSEPGGPHTLVRGDGFLTPVHEDPISEPGS
jgi:gluconate 2-dehydrogenase gamma chain